MLFRVFLTSLIIAAIFVSPAFADVPTEPVITDFNYDATGEGRLYLKAKLDRPAKFRLVYRLSGENKWIYPEWSSVPLSEPEMEMVFTRGRVIHWYMEFRDDAGNLNRTPTYEISSYPYLRGYLNINDGALTTASPQVNLQLTTFDPEYLVYQMSFSNDGKTWSEWEPFYRSKSWHLSSGEGLKKAYVRFKNTFGFIMNRPAGDAIYYTGEPSPAGITPVEIKGRQFFVRGRPYKIKGVCWQRLAYLVAARYKQDIALMKEMGVNTIRTLADISDNPDLVKEVLDEFYRNDILVILSLDHLLSGPADFAKVERLVTQFKNHPAILAWQLGAGNYDPVGIETEKAAERIKQLDPFHPVTRIIEGTGNVFFAIPGLGEDWPENVVEKFAGKYCPAIDIWGINYMNDDDTFGGLFYEWRQISPKPMFIAMANRSRYDPQVSQDEQAAALSRLWQEVYFRLSADRQDEPCLGITYFPWDDSYMGLINADFSRRRAFFAIEDRYKKGGLFVNLPWDIKLKAVSASGASFLKDDRAFYRKGAGGGGGRGLNFAVIDPYTGLIEAVKNFDPWADNYAGTPEALLHARGYLEGIPDGKIILAAVGEETGLSSGSLYYEVIFQTMESLGSRLIRQVKYQDTWAILSIKGRPGNLAEAYHPYTEAGGWVPAEAEAVVPLGIDVDRDGVRDDIDTDRDNDNVGDIREADQGTDPLDIDTDDDGTDDSGAPINKPPLAKITAYPMSGNSPLRVRFSAGLSSDPDGRIVSYYWSFGNGAHSRSPSPTYTYYNRSGGRRRYNVSLTVRDNNGSASTASAQIVVYPSYWRFF